MSLFDIAEIECPACKHWQDVQLAGSVNADRRPDLRTAILNRSFQARACEMCGGPLRFPLHLTYLDMRRGVWVLADDADAISQWSTLVDEARSLFDSSFGASAPAPARSLAEGVSPRIVFGWPALREKIICNDLGLDDATLELAKLSIMRNRADLAMGLDASIRLVGARDENLVFEIANDETEAISGAFEFPRSLHDDIRRDDAWAELRAALSAPFVDVKRLLIESEVGAPA